MDGEGAKHPDRKGVKPWPILKPFELTQQTTYSFENEGYLCEEDLCGDFCAKDVFVKDLCESGSEAIIEDDKGSRTEFIENRKRSGQGLERSEKRHARENNELIRKRCEESSNEYRGFSSKYLVDTSGCYTVVTSDNEIFYIPKLASLGGEHRSASTMDSHIIPLYNDKKHIYQTIVDIEKERRAGSEAEARFEVGAKVGDEVVFEDEAAFEVKEASAMGHYSTENSTGQVVANMPDTGDKKKILMSRVYTPKSYIDLITNEATNREVYRWVKSWDACRKGVYEKIPRDELLKVIPKNKVLIINGPPVSGKTSLCKVIVKHAKYRLVEVDPNEDNSTINSKTRLINAIENKTLFSDTSTFNAVLIEDIDKINFSSNNEYQDFFNTMLEYATGENDMDNSRKKRQRIQTSPIICTVTNLYTPNLIKLRKISYIVNLKKPSEVSIMDRLYNICLWQSINVDYQILSALCKMSNHDIVHCIEMLQLFVNNYSKLNIKTLENLASNMCCENKFDIHTRETCRMIFSREMNSNFRVQCDNSSHIGDYENIDHTKSKFNALYDRVSMCLDNEKLFYYCFSNYLRASNVTFGQKIIGESIIGVPRLELALRFSEFFDLVNTQIKSTMNFDITPYAISSICAFNVLFGSSKHIQFDYSIADILSRQMKSKVLACINSFKSTLITSSSLTMAFINKHSLISEIIPYVLLIITPDLAIKSVDIFSGTKNDKILQLANIMISIGLRWIQKLSVDENAINGYENLPVSNKTIFFLEPPIDMIIHSLNTPLYEVMPIDNKYGKLQFNSRRDLSKPVTCRLSDVAKQQVSVTVKKISINNSSAQSSAEKRKEFEMNIFSSMKNDYGNMVQIDKEHTSNTECSTHNKNAMPLENFLIRAGNQSRNLSPAKKVYIVFEFSDGYTCSVKKHITIRELLRIKPSIIGKLSIDTHR